jgi:hypothetical protein
MSTETENDKLAATVGQDKPEKDGCCALDKKIGVYDPKLPELTPRNLEQAKSTVSPFGAVKKP